tara:strand:+ start:172575 stop:172838 length:264 start_codon:yes stop_codon:yes gene_type:complete
LTSRQNRIEARLREEFSPDELSVVDESRLHAGHAGASEEGESHFFVEITSSAFSGKSRVDMQRLVNEALKAEFASGLHALRLKTKAV